jgi:hypothetical protein
MAAIKYGVNGGRPPLDLNERNKRIPGDLENPLESALNILRFGDYIPMFRNASEPMDSYDLLKIITQIEQHRFNLETLGNAFTPIVITVGTTPTLLLAPNKEPRGYIFLNPSQVVTGVTTDTTLFVSAARAAGTFTSAQINVQAFRTSRFFVDITAAPTTLQVNILTKDPVSAKFAFAQINIFNGAVGNPGQVVFPAVGTYYADAGEIGTDDFIQIQVVQTGAGTWSMGMVSKEAYQATLSPPAIFLGNANVISGLGYPLLGGTKEKFLLLDNTPLYGVATAATPIRIFHLQ